MRDRKKQRELRKRKEEKIDIRDSSGILDPTPYYAVQNIIERERAENKAAAMQKGAVV